MATAGSASPSLTSSSHTLTAGSATMPPPPLVSASTTSNMSAGAALLESIAAQNRHFFLQPPSSLPATSLQLAKETLDAFAGQVSDEQQTRLREESKKRKREAGGLGRAEVLKIRKLHVDGFETGQVWQQAKRIINSTLRESRDVIKELEEKGEVEDTLPNGAKAAEDPEEDAMALESASDGSELDSDEDDDASSSSGELDSAAEIDEGEDELDGEESDVDAEIDEILDVEAEESGSGSGSDDDEDGEDDPTEGFVEDPNGLNDPFFSLEEFNKQTQWFEDQDARADPNTDAASDDEEIDWHADPMAMAKGKSDRKSSTSKAGEDPLDIVDDIDEDDDEDDDEAGPTFGDMDLDAPEGDSDDEFGKGLEDGLDMGLDLTANDIFYDNFFAPPKKARKGGKPKRKERPQLSQPDEADMERAVNDVRRDLFEDLSEHSDSEDALSDVSDGNPKARRSAHERRQAKLAEEIRKLEAESVAKRAWTLSGEAAAADRPINSLLAEDLDFEHAGKPVPVITEEVSESIEELIKRRILAQEFDEVIRRRPDSLADGSRDTRRGLVELDDSKAKQSLAEIYEEDHVKRSNPDSYLSKSDEKLRQDEKEVEAMWKEISAKLDALSSWHYKPRPAAPSLTVVADVATVSMEDAQPTTAQGVGGGESMIAPQEVYKAGKETAERGEVVAKSGLPVARQEMSREEKLRRRRREKERIRKSGGGEQGKKPLSKKAQEQKDTMGDLRKGGVRVINRKGEIVDLDGKRDTGRKAEVTSGSFKL